MKTAPLLFSVIIPAYNYGKSLKRAALSVLEQGFSDCELIIINDGSKDNTEAIAKALLESYSNIRYANQSNQGLAATRNKGIELSLGRYLIFLDADDKLLPQSLLSYQKAIQDNPDAAMVFGDHLSIDSQGKSRICFAGKLANQPLQRLKDYLIDKKLSLSNGAVAISRKVFDQYQYPVQFRSAEDISMFAYILANFPVVPIAQPLLAVYKHEDSLRHNIHFAKEVNVKLVDEVFAPQRMPQHFQVLKPLFYTQRCLSLSRSCYLARDYAGCFHFFKRAFAYNWRCVLKWAYSKKALYSYYKMKRKPNSF